MSAEARVGNLYVRVAADIGALSAGFSEGIQKAQAFGKDLSAVGTNLTARVTAPIIAIGGAAIAMSHQMEDGLFTIRRGTGATGEALAGLEEVFRGISGTVPATFQEIGTAVADLNTRTGLTGSSLENLARQMLQLSHASGEDVGELIRTTTRLFGDWSVATDDQSAALDKLFQTSQATGITVAQLADVSTNFGVQFRALGLSFEETTAMLASWEKEGVASEKILSGMSIAVRTLGEQASEQGITMRDAFLNFRDSIMAADVAQGEQIARSVVGARASADLALAIQEGRLNFENFAATIAGSSDTIAGASNATVDFSERMAMLGQKVAKAAEPLGIALEGALTSLIPLMEVAIEKVARMVEWFTNLSPVTQGVILGITGLVAAAGPLLIVVGSAISAFAGLALAIPTVTAGLAVLTGPIGITVAAVAGLGLAWSVFGDDIARIVDGVSRAVAEWVGGIVAKMSEIFEPVIQVTESFGNMTGAISQFLVDLTLFVGEKLEEIVGAAFHWLRDRLNPILEPVGRVFSTISGFVGTCRDTVLGIVQRIVDRTWEIFTGGLSRVADAVSAGMDTVTGFFQGMSDVLVGNSIVPDMMGMIWDEFDTMKTDITSLTEGGVSGVIEKFTGLKAEGGLPSIAAEAFNAITGQGGSLSTFVTDFTSDIEGLKTDVTTKWGEIKAAFENPLSFETLGKDWGGFFSGLATDLIGFWDRVKGFWDKLSAGFAAITGGRGGTGAGGFPGMENIPVSFSVAQVPFAAAAAVPSSPFLGVDPGRSSANPWLAPAAPESATTHVSIHIGSIDARGQADPARFADEIYEALNERLGKGVLRDGRTTAGIITSL